MADNLAVCTVQYRAQQLATAATLRHWIPDSEYVKEQYSEAQTNLLSAIFDDIDNLADRIEDVMDNINDVDAEFRDFAFAIACDLVGKDLNEALRERQEAEDAA